ncbi:histidinol-phosphate aminotransferase 2 [Kordiimonas sediminis]|uniref:Histidinol-phosphate aminotransferase n=1 Tax=Kordiimonas sediminis TaxID=1735581 RepID=A0A919AIQ7_9PROT|nr:histidinol-phosphate transaminase [Kordiimonas sediminis]GHF11744.1 histidinol-phosphate aminotransferase 2 [Kordiimonas sediminis]
MSQSGPQAHPWIMNLNPYVPGKASLDNGRPVVKLSANESVFGPSPAALEAARTAADDICRYPDGGSHALRHAIADVHSLDADRIVCGAGSDDLLTLLIHAYAGPGKEVIYSQYGFMVYPLVTESVGATGIAVPNKNWAADVDGILDAVTDNTTLVFIDNPNNPTGAYLNWDEIKRLHSSLPAHVLLVLDAAYAECVTAEDYKAGEELVDAFDNVVMTRTFSKMYALAGLRVGWAYAPAAVVDILNRIRMPFNVCLPGQYAAIAAMQDQAHLKASVEFNREWRNWVRARLMALGLDVVESETNFLLIEFPDESPFTAKEANAYLMDNGYILRHLGFLPNHLRLSIGTEEQNRAVVELLTAFMSGAGHSDPALS